MAILFEIYREGRRATEFLLSGAYVTGPESIAVDGHVSFEGGLVVVEPPREVAVEPGGELPTAYGVCLLWDVGEPGSYLLETTRLPPREQPYILNVELARHRLMRIVHKQEDWNLWDGVTPSTVDALRRVREAQSVFASALTNLQNPAEASRLADSALSLAIQASEELAIFQAEASMARRRSGAGARAMFGVRADPGVRNAKYRGTLARFFDYAVVPVSWRSLQPEEDRFETEAADSTVEFLARNRIPVIAGPLLSLAEGEVPEWLFIYEHEFESLRDLAFDYVRSVVTRYRRIIRVWNVVSGLHVNNGFDFSFEQTLELTRLLVGQVKAVSPQAKTVVTIRMPFGEYLAAAGSRGVPGIPPHLYAEMVAQSGVECDGFGLELEMGLPRRGTFCRDLFQISAMLERFATLGKPVFLTAVACPDRDTGRNGLNPADGGRWRSPWSPEVQAQWLREVYRIALSKPFIENVAWADLCDESAQTMVPGSGLLDDLLRPKLAFDALQDLRKAMRPPQPPPGQAPTPAGTMGQAAVPAGAVSQAPASAAAPPPVTGP